MPTGSRTRRDGDTLKTSTMDPASGIAIPVAFGAGLISFLSPCVLPLVPGYISAVAGVTPSEIRPRRVIGPSLAFVASDIWFRHCADTAHCCRMML